MGRAHEVRKQSMEKTAAMKSAIYGRAAKEIYMAAKNGSDPSANLALRSAIDKAKSNQVPADVIQRAIKRAEGGDAESYAENHYEGYGAGGSMVIVDSLTSNVNRAIAEIRDAFNKNGGKIAQTGAVSHSFNSISLFIFAATNKDVEATLELLMETDAEVNDVFEEDENTVIYGAFQSFNVIKKALDDAGITEYVKAETTMIPSEYVDLNEEDKAKFEKMINKLNELEDVQNVYHNVNM
jgi:YebC/PmpR family DNA-binding regulatory protein